MSDENKIVEEKPTCICQNKEFRHFLTIAGGSFVGVFLALSLFAALHRPPMPPIPPMAPCPCGYQMVRPCPHHHFDRADHGDFHKKMIKKHRADRPDRPMPPRGDRPAPEIDD